MDELTGFENPGWTLDGNGRFLGGFRDGGLWFENDPIHAPNFEEVDGDTLYRNVFRSDTGSFVSTLAIRDHILDVETGVGSGALLGLNHIFAWPNRLFLIIEDVNENDDEVEYEISWRSGDSSSKSKPIDRGPHILLSIMYDEPNSQVTFQYDNNLDDEVNPITVAVEPYSGPVT